MLATDPKGDSSRASSYAVFLAYCEVMAISSSTPTRSSHHGDTSVHVYMQM